MRVLAVERRVLVVGLRERAGRRTGAFTGELGFDLSSKGLCEGGFIPSRWWEISFGSVRSRGRIGVVVSISRRGLDNENVDDQTHLISLALFPPSIRAERTVGTHNVARSGTLRRGRLLILLLL